MKNTDFNAVYEKTLEKNATYLAYYHTSYSYTSARLDQFGNYIPLSASYDTVSMPVISSTGSLLQANES
jgi:hypothetical protein